jgi:hypothetical protein
VSWAVVGRTDPTRVTFRQHAQRVSSARRLKG